MAEKRVTLADVARRAGLSSSAASMILNGRPGTRLSEDAHRRVHDAALQLGYRPNVAARSLRTDRTATIGFISDVVATTRFASGLIRGALAAAEEAGHVVFVLETGGDPDREAQAVRAMLDRQVDGLIFASMQAREVTVPEVPRGIPVIMLNATNALHANSVLPDEEAGGADAVRLLLEQGLGDAIVLLGRNTEIEHDTVKSSTIARRMLGIRSEMRAHGFSFLEEIPSPSWEPGDGYAATTALLERRDDVRALLCMNDRLAFGAYQAIAETSLNIPENISIASFDDDEIAGYLRPGLTTVALPHEAMGRAAVQVLLTSRPAGPLLVPMPVRARGSIRHHQTSPISPNPAPTHQTPTLETTE
ncbi:LacI family DNA-binding transcriptional regulator [Cryobacterium lactosi]|uniref:LacI family DNA-binding transcriptional regulator n=1 Tax=Cryobacterium lactosi TaxID=1259202 RepID=A0A4R9BQD1_9MICO|nr:LacI family DNA-binding transcriptional regulator [Cryobacterium lactosi]TFD88643.1 LacI family DNA-binding transcriptional regulator [Cryobacterium lactosi]